MPRRAATITQADVARVIRAVQAAGLPVARVIVRPDGVAVETFADPDRPGSIDGSPAPIQEKPRVVL